MSGAPYPEGIAKLSEALRAQGRTKPKYKVLIFGEGTVRGGIFEVTEDELSYRPVAKPKLASE